MFASVERMTMWPEKGSCCHMYSKASLSFGSGTCHATSAPSARLVASMVWRGMRGKRSDLKGHYFSWVGAPHRGMIENDGSPLCRMFDQLTGTGTVLPAMRPPHRAAASAPSGGGHADSNYSQADVFGHGD